MDIVTKLPWLVRSAIRKLGQTSTIAVVVAILIAWSFIGSAIVTMSEMLAGSTGGLVDYFRSLWWFIVTVTGLGLLVPTPATQPGQAASAFAIIMARIFFGMFIGSIASWIINRLLMEGKGMGSVTVKGHVIVCGWNPRGPEIVSLLRRDEKHGDTVILADVETAPVRASGVHFVRGDPSMEKNLQRASVSTADSVIVLADQAMPGAMESTMDGRSVLIALTVKKMNPNAYIVAEVRQAENREHFVIAGVDEILVGNDLLADMLARAASNHGLSQIVTDLLTLGRGGGEIYIVPLPSAFIGEPFDDVLIQLQTTRRMILFGIARGEELVLNPQDPLILTRGDSLVLVAKERPKLD